MLTTIKSMTRVSLCRCVMLAIILLGYGLSACGKERMNQSISLPDGSRQQVFGQSNPRHAIIWLHGLGATADDFPPIVPELGLDPSRSIYFIFPQAPNRPITINGGMSMPGWYDIKGVRIEDKQDTVGMTQSRSTIDGIIEQLINAGFESKNIILAGFSQGGAVSYYTALRSEHRLGGLLALSTYLPFLETTQNEASSVNQDIPIFASHGTYDPVVPMQLGQMSAEELQRLGYEVKWQTYPMEHQVVMEQITDIGNWINQVFEKVDGE